MEAVANVVAGDAGPEEPGVTDCAWAAGSGKAVQAAGASKQAVARPWHPHWPIAVGGKNRFRLRHIPKIASIESIRSLL
jgi:hypothetical protein